MRTPVTPENHPMVANLPLGRRAAPLPMAEAGGPEGHASPGADGSASPGGLWPREPSRLPERIDFENASAVGTLGGFEVAVPVGLQEGGPQSNRLAMRRGQRRRRSNIQ